MGIDNKQKIKMCLLIKENFSSTLFPYNKNSRIGVSIKSLF